MTTKEKEQKIRQRLIFKEIKDEQEMNKMDYTCLGVYSLLLITALLFIYKG